MNKHNSNITNDADSANHSVADYTPQAVKHSVQELLKFGVLYSHDKPQLYRHACTASAAINRILSALDLQLKIDEVRGLAFLCVAEDGGELPIEPSTVEADTSDTEDDWSHPLVRRQRLNVEQSLLIAILRQHYVVHEQNTGIGIAPAVMDVDEVQSQLALYLGESGSDAKDEKRARNLLDNLKTHGIVSEINDQAQFTIRPLIAHIASPQTLMALLQHFRQLTHDNGESEHAKKAIQD